MSWNYRIIRVEKYGQQCLGIYEVYYDENGVPCSRTAKPVGDMFYDDLDEIKSELKHMLEGTARPILEDFASKYETEDEGE